MKRLGYTATFVLLAANLVKEVPVGRLVDEHGGFRAARERAAVAARERADTARKELAGLNPVTVTEVRRWPGYGERTVRGWRLVGEGANGRHVLLDFVPFDGLHQPVEGDKVILGGEPGSYFIERY